MVNRYMCRYLHTEEGNVSSYHCVEKRNIINKQLNYAEINPARLTMIVRINP